MIRKFYLIVGLILLVLSVPAFSEDIKPIKNPKPNMMESRYVQLKKIKTIDADLGNGEYLFKPLSLTADRDSVYVYDILQARIFQFDTGFETVKRSFGGSGAGPGEFGGTGKTNPVFIQMGRDGKLYANVIMMRKVIVFDRSGKYLGEFKNTILDMHYPLVDHTGNLYILNVKDKRVNIFNEKKIPLYSLKNQRDSFNYLFSTPGTFYLKMASKNLAGELFSALTVDSTFLIYFPSSSTLYSLKDKKTTKMTIRPEEALSCHKDKLAELLKEEKNNYKFMFSKLMVDEGNADVFFLQLGRNKKRGINALYQFNINGDLQKVLYVILKESESFTRFEVKARDMFYAIQGDGLIIYKEDIQ